MDKILKVLFVMYVPGSPRPRLCRFVLALLLGSFALSASTGSAHETDNFYLPLDVELADLSDFFGTVHTWAIERAVAEVNAKIEQASSIKDSAARAKRLAQFHDPDAIASAVASRFEDDPYREESAVLRRLSDEFELCAYGLHEVRREWERAGTHD
jgi:hypothetical protein